MLISRALVAVGSLTGLVAVICLIIHFRLPRWRIQFRICGVDYGGTYEAAAWNNRDAIAAMHRCFQRTMPEQIMIVESFERIPIR